jgi:hypothetical protein
MRFWFVVLLMALLPLRGWVGDAMAVSMSMAEAHADSAVTSTPACHEAAAATDEAPAQAHLLCDLCNGPALAVASPLAMADHRPQGLLIPARVAFASEPVRRDVRPPIA